MHESTGMGINLMQNQVESSYFKTLLNIWCSSDLQILATFYSSRKIQIFFSKINCFVGSPPFVLKLKLLEAKSAQRH